MEDNKNKLPNFDLDLSVLQNALDNTSDEKTDDTTIDNSTVVDDTTIDNDNQQNPSSDNDSPLIHFAKYLSDEGIFAEEDLQDFKGTPEELAERITKLADRLAEAKMENYAPEAKKFIELINSGVSEKDAQNIVKQHLTLDKINDETLENDIEVQKDIIRQYLSKTGLPEEDIDEQITLFEDTDKLYTKSVNFHARLKSLAEKEEQLAKDRAEVEKKEMEKHYQNQLTEIKERIDKTKEIIPGFTINETMKEKIFKNITTPAKVIDGVPVSAVALKREKDPIQFEITLNLLNELGVFDGKFDLLLNAGKKKSVEEFENAIKTSDFFNRSTSKKEEDKTKEMLDSLKELPQFKI